MITDNHVRKRRTMVTRREAALQGYVFIHVLVALVSSLRSLSGPGRHADLWTIEARPFFFLFYNQNSIR